MITTGLRFINFGNNSWSSRSTSKFWNIGKTLKEFYGFLPEVMHIFSVPNCEVRLQQRVERMIVRTHDIHANEIKIYLSSKSFANDRKQWANVW